MIRKVKPIARNDLPHSATLKKVTGTDSYNKKTFAADVALKFIRVEPVHNVKTVAAGEDKEMTNFLVFYDSVNSKPNDVVFDEGDQIIFKGKTLNIVLVDDQYAFDGDKVHHYEIGCK